MSTYCRRHLLRAAREPAAEGGAGPAAAPAPQIDFYHQHGPGFVEPIVEKFHGAQDRVRISPVFVAGGYEGLLEKLVADVLGGKPPAVAQAGFTYTQFMIKRVPVVPVRLFLEADKVPTADVFPSMLALGQDAAGKQWALPLAVSTPVLYYNAALFRARGLDPGRPPATWAAVAEAARALTQGEQVGVCFNHTITGNWLFQAMMECAGGRMVTPDGRRARFQEEPGVRALTYWADLANRDRTKVLNAPGLDLFYAGKLAMYVHTVASLENIRRALAWPAEELRTAVFPTDGARPRRVPAGGNNLFITAREPAQQRAAWEFIKYFLTPQGTSDMAQASGYMAVRRAALTTPALLGDHLAANPAKRSTYDQVNDMVPWHEFDTDQAVQVRTLIFEAQTAALLGQTTPKLALEGAAAQVQPLLNR
jgi:multiple sugar transport system substrate-binding protein